MKKHKSLKTNYYYMIASIVLFLFIITLFYVVYKNHRKTVVEQQNNQLYIIASIGTNYLKTYVDEKNLELQNMFTIKDLGSNPKQIERKVEEVIKLYWNQSPIYLDYLKYFTIDELKTAHIAGLDTESLNNYRALAIKNNELIVGPFVQINDNNMGIYLFKGIFNEYGKFGMLIGRINLSMVFHSTISNIELGKAGFLTLSDIDETFSFYGNRDGLYFAGEYPEIFSQDNYLVSYSFTEVGNLNLLVSARIPYNEIEKPIKITFYLLLSLSIGLLLLFATFSYVLFHYKKKELEYSMDMRIQEQLHQGNRNEVIGLFARKVAHDYNNLLAPITIYCELLQDSLTNEELLDYVNEIHQSSEQCGLLAKELLEYGRSQPTKNHAIIYDSTITVKETLKRIQLLLSEHITLKSEISSESLYLKGQPLELVQIIYNLCINSIHAMEETNHKTDTLTVSFAKEENHAILTIKDTGNGIPKALHSKIFTTEFTTKKEDKGNGLGLPIVSGIVEKYHGNISFSSQIGKGTTFIVRLPLAL